MKNPSLSSSTADSGSSRSSRAIPQDELKKSKRNFSESKIKSSPPVKQKKVKRQSSTKLSKSKQIVDLQKNPGESEIKSSSSVKQKQVKRQSSSKLPKPEQIDDSKKNQGECEIKSSSPFSKQKKIKRQSSTKLPKQEQTNEAKKYSYLQKVLCAGCFMVIFVAAAVFAVLQMRVKGLDYGSNGEAGMQNPTLGKGVIANCSVQNSTTGSLIDDSPHYLHLLFVETNVVMPKSTSVIEAISLLSKVMGSELETLIAQDIIENGCFQVQEKASAGINRNNQGIQSINVIPSNHSETGSCVLDDSKSCHKIDFTVELTLDPYMNVNTFLLVRNLDLTLNGNEIYTQLRNLKLNVDMVQILSVSEIEPTKSPTEAPTKENNLTLTEAPSQMPSDLPSSAPSEIVATYIPGKLTVRSNDLLLSEGLSCRVIAKTGHPVNLTGLVPPNHDGTIPVSEDIFHIDPDGAGVFEVMPVDDHTHLVEGGWVYVSNSENDATGQGGVGGIYFNEQGEVIDYRRILKGSTNNCSGGKTPWGSWVSCEERDGGQVYQVDPMGIRPPQLVSAIDDGYFEAFAYDIRNASQPRFFVTEDHPEGALRRFTPKNPNWDDPWNLLHGEGTLDYLILEPYSTSNPSGGGTFSWTDRLSKAKDNAERYYQYTEGIDVYNGELFVVSKIQKELFILDLDARTYKVLSTKSGLFDGTPDQLKRLVHEDGDGSFKTMLYFCEEDGTENGVHAKDENGFFFTILESAVTLDNKEVTGLAFSPDGKHMYVSYQRTGLIYDIWRDDGLPFHARTLNVRYHNMESAKVRRR